MMTKVDCMQAFGAWCPEEEQRHQEKIEQIQKEYNIYLSAGVLSPKQLEEWLALNLLAEDEYHKYFYQLFSEGKEL